MSSDDSEGEIHSEDRRLFIRTLPWRDAVITKWLHGIDTLPNNEVESLKNPAHPRLERLPGNGVTSRSVPPRLPRVLYSEEWLSQQSHATISRLQLSTSLFRLPYLDNSSIGQAEYVYSDFLFH